MRFLGHPVCSFNLEITNKCALACPKCDRTGNEWVQRNPVEISPELLRRVFPLSSRGDFQGLLINLCGPFGDCIYHSRFHEMVRHLKDAGFVLNIETNGSYRDARWWSETCGLLADPKDHVTFSVDGLEDTNHLYRINSRWPDIVTAMRVCAPRVKTQWKFIVFRHNEHQLPAAQRLASELGLRRITFKKSARFRGDDGLAPNDGGFIGAVARNRQKIRDLLQAGAACASGARARELDRLVTIRPRCAAGRSLAVMARGFFFPCTSCETSEPDSWFHRNEAGFDLRSRSLGEIMADPCWKELQDQWERASQAPRTCLTTCGVHRDCSQDYLEQSRPGRPNKPDDVVSVELSQAPAG